MSARHVIASSFMSLDDDEATQTFFSFPESLKILDAIKFASYSKIEPDFEYANIFPGEHYRLLSGLIHCLNPLVLVDIGTYRGSSARVMLDFSSDAAEVHTYDLYDYLSFDWTVLKESDFYPSGKLKQHLVDLIDSNSFELHRDNLKRADFIMLDGPKDGNFEENFLHKLKNIESTGKSKWLFIDDIRFDNMQDLWRSIKSPKLDISSFGHFSGSGLVNMTEGLLF